MLNDDVEVPDLFKCPISMELMKDPVTVCTGISYDRQNIETWIYEYKKRTCPATKQILHSTELTPNHTLRRLVQSWCSSNAHLGVIRVSTPRTPAAPSTVLRLLNDPDRFHSLQKLRFLAQSSESNRRVIASVPGFVRSLYHDLICKQESISFVALQVLSLLAVKSSAIMIQVDVLASLGNIIRKGSIQARMQAIILVDKISPHIGNWEWITTENTNIFENVVWFLRNNSNLSNQVETCVIGILISMCRASVVNKTRAISARCVFTVIEMIASDVNSNALARTERLLELLDMLVDCDEGKVAMMEHAMGMAVVSNRMVGVSKLCTVKCVKILWSICMSWMGNKAIKELVHCGGMTQLCLLLHLEYGERTKRRSQDILKFHRKTSIFSPFFPLYEV